jgi:hypothetical protein
MKKLLKYLLIAILFIILTILTQIGGVILLLSIWLSNIWKINSKFKVFFIFLMLYLILTFLIVPHIAPIFGREKVIDNNQIEPTNYMTILLNRNYVRPKVNNLLEETAKHLNSKNIKIKYLDTSFPFIDNFPLFPHLSHNDGKKIDISFIYQNKNGVITNDKKSISGYGVFVPPRKGEYNQTKSCKSRGYFQYDYPKYLTFGRINNELIFSEKGTKELINALLKSKKLGKLFIEPNLKSRLRLNDNRVRNHGCRAVRHDDHIHIQLK